MLGRYVRINVTNPIHSVNKQIGLEYKLNFGKVEGVRCFDKRIAGAYIMGMNHPVRSFDGRVIGIIRPNDCAEVRLVVAPKSMTFIDNEITDAIAFAEKCGEYSLDCLYERSCGAVVYRLINDEIRFLLIKNKRSAHWGFPKGHMEKGETPAQTAAREVREETGLRIEIEPAFEAKSEYTMLNRVEKCVTVFLAKTQDTDTRIQREEIDDYIWLNFERAYDTLRFDNDKAILKKANDFLVGKTI